MIKSFDDAFVSLIDTEKGYWDDPAGGPTMFGVTEKVARARGYAGDMHALPLSFAKAVAKTDYWDPYQCDQFDARIAYQVFDAAYNGGHPVQWLQQAAGCAVDGSIGAVTIAAVRAASVPAICLSFNASRLVYMAGLNNWDANSEGWARRIAKCMLIGMP